MAQLKRTLSQSWEDLAKQPYFSKVIYMWLLTIEKEQKCHQNNNIYCKSEVRWSLGLTTEFK